MSQYYYLVSGLPDISPDDAKLSLGYTDYLDELMQSLSRHDAHLLSYFRMDYENRNLLAWLKDKEAALHPLGQLTAEDFQEQLQLIDFEERGPLPGVPPYFLTFLRERAEGLIAEGQEENRLTALFYEYVSHCSNAFVREWFAFSQTLNNLLLALSCRKYGWDVESQLVGDSEIVQQLRTSTARDFGLSQLFPQTEAVLRLSEEEDLLEREKKTDRIKWDFLDELSSTCYFSVEVLLVYLIKLQSLERWMELDPRSGEEKFRALIASMKSTVQTQAK